MTSHISAGKKGIGYYAEPLSSPQDFTRNLPPELVYKILSFLPSSALREMKLVNRQWRVYVQHEMLFRCKKRLNETVHQIEPLLAPIQPHVKQEDVDAFIRLKESQEAFETSNRSDLEEMQSSINQAEEILNRFRRPFILSLASSETAFDPVQENSLLNILVDLDGELKLIIRLARVVQDIKRVETEFMAVARVGQYRAIFEGPFLNSLNPQVSELVIADIVALVNPEAGKILMVQLLSTNECLVGQFIKQFKGKDRDFIFKNWVTIMIARNDFDGAEEKIKHIQTEEFKLEAMEKLVVAFIQNNFLDKALEVFRRIHNHQNLESRKSLVIGLVNAVEFSEEKLRSPEGIALFLKNMQVILEKQDLPAFYTSFFSKASSSFGNQLARLKADIAENLIEHREFPLVMLIATDRTLSNQEFTKDLQSKIFHNYLQTLPQDSVAKDLAIKTFLKEFPYFQQTGFRAYLIVSMLEHGLYEDALIQLKNSPRGFKDRSYSYEYLQVHLEEFINAYIKQEDYRKVLELSRYIEVRNQILFSCILDKVDQSQEGSFEERWSRVINEVFPELSLEDKQFLEVYKQAHISRLPLDTK